MGVDAGCNISKPDVVCKNKGGKNYNSRVRSSNSEALTCRRFEYSA